MKKTTRKNLRRLCIAVFIISTLLLLRQFFDNAGGEESYDTARTVAAQKQEPGPTEAAAGETVPTETVQPVLRWIPAPIEEEDEHIASLEELDIGALQEVNPDVVGWLFIPDSPIDYPLLQGEDNDFYLKHTWEKNPNSVGSIFLEYRNSPDFTDFNTILYGHNMNDGSMFADITRFTTQWYWERHPYIYVVLPEGVLRYEVFSAYMAPIDGPTYGLSFHQLQTRLDFLAYALEKAMVDTGIEPGTAERILTLSTCTGNGYSNRWVVHARLRMIQAEE